MRIGVFDSGKGGEIVAERLKEIFRDHEFVTVNDRQNLPYGDKTAGEIAWLTEAAIRRLLRSCEIIIIACNTATALAINVLRAKYPNTKFIGFEPAIKPAAHDTRAQKIMVLATPATLKSAKYWALKKRVAANIQVIEPDCSAWAKKIEDGDFTEADLAPVVELAKREAIDEIVLGCTHYLALQTTLQKLLPGVIIQQPIDGVARRLRSMLEL